MHKQLTNIDNRVHVKVEYNNEFRRFALNEISYAALQTSLQGVLNVEESIKVKFQDDEKDWVQLSSDQELRYAIELAGSPLRILVQLASETSKPEDNEGLQGRWRGRGCRGGRGGRCGGRHGPLREDIKSARISSRIENLEAELSDNTLSSERERVVRWRLEKLQNKLARVQALKEAFDQPAEEVKEVKEETPAPVPDTNQGSFERPWRGRGRGGRCGGQRRCGRFAEGEGHHGHHGCKKWMQNLPEEVVENFLRSKSNLQAARQSGNPQEIQACLEAFIVAKQQRKEARRAMFQTTEESDQK